MKRLSLFCCAVLGTAFAAQAQPPELDPILRDTLKGGAVLTHPPTLPQTYLGMTPKAASSTQRLCGPQYAAAPTAIGSRDQYAKLGGLVQNVGKGLLAKALSTATGGAVQSGGGGKQNAEPQPALHEDPIDKKHRSKLKDKTSGTRLNMGGRAAKDGVLISTRLDRAEDDGTVQEIYLERDDCRRIYPSADYAYELWGKWNLSVSWTKTTSTYQDGKLIDRQTSTGGYMKSGEWLHASGAGTIGLDELLKDVPPELREGVSAYQSQIFGESGPPVWQRLGFGAPTSGARSIGSVFKLSEGDLLALREGRMAAVVQVTRERGPLYEAVGIPMAVAPGEGNHLTFSLPAK